MSIYTTDIVGLGTPPPLTCNLSTFPPLSVGLSKKRGGLIRHVQKHQASKHGMGNYLTTDVLSNRDSGDVEQTVLRRRKRRLVGQGLLRVS